MVDSSENINKLHFELALTAIREEEGQAEPGAAVWRQYYYAEGVRVALREGQGSGTTGLRFLLGDHLGSTHVTTDAIGTKLAELRYKPWGDVRHTEGNTPTSFRFTGQREETDLGIYYYGARWYDPALGHFLQADTIIPRPGNPLAWNRFAYTLYNPVKYTDPSGHRVCEAAFDCSAPVKTKYTEGEYIAYLSAEYGWVIDKEEFSYREVKVIHETSEQIRNYASSQTGGRGKEWMNEYLQPVFAHNFDNSNFSWVPLPGQFSNVVFLTPGFAEASNAVAHVTHELGHVLDNATGNRLGAAVWAGGGWADELVRHVGGNPPPVLPRFYNGNGGIPSDLRFKTESHASDGTAEYFAYTFQYAVTDPKNQFVPAAAIEWLNVKVAESITP